MTLFLCCASYSSIKQTKDSFISRAILKSWRRKAEEQKGRLLDRLPTNVERSFTPVSFETDNFILILKLLYFNLNKNVYTFLLEFKLNLIAGSHKKSRISSRDSSSDHRRRVNNCSIILLNEVLKIQ
jgi:hypothetical protein